MTHEQDRSTGLVPTVGVGLVVLRGCEVLLIKRGKPPKQGQWSLPGGRVEGGETSKQAALRELAEETGVQADLAGLLDVVDLIDTDAGLHYVLVDYVGHWIAGEPIAGDDAVDARFWPLDAIDALGLWDETRRVITLAAERFPAP